MGYHDRYGWERESIVAGSPLVPTLRQVAGLEPNLPRVDAPSLLPLLAGERPGSWPPLFCEVDFDPEEFQKVDRGDAAPLPASHMRGLVADGFKLIVDDVSRKMELYDLANDPGELHDLADARPDETRRLLALLEEMHASAKRGAPVGTRVELSSEELDVLGDLGYAEPGASGEGSSSGEPDR
jgi:arylsulfatase A-like enzyme